MKNMFRCLFTALFISFSLSTIVSADEELNIWLKDLNRTKAEDYLKEYSKLDHYWIWQNPYISWEKKFYSDSDENPSYIEYKVSCKDTVDCWYIIVNIDESDSPTPMSSSSWKTLSEMMWWSNSEQTKNYYFSPFEQFSENEQTWEIRFTNPNNKIIVDEEYLKRVPVISTNSVSTNSLNSLQSTKELRNNILKEKLNTFKREARDYKESEELKEFRKKLNSIDRKTKENNIVKLSTDRITTMAVWDQGPMDEYFLMKTVPWEWWWKNWCPGKIPCYNQSYVGIWNFITKYCTSWCWPNAFAMIFWYYNRAWLYKNLISWVWLNQAPLTNNMSINKLQSQLYKHLKTICDEDNLWSTSIGDHKLISNYLKERWYSTNITTYFLDTKETPFYHWEAIKDISKEINEGRPMVMFLKWTTKKNWKETLAAHSIVVFWYSTRSNDTRINANFWRGANFSNVNIDIQRGNRFTREWKTYTYRVAGYLGFKIL